MYKLPESYPFIVPVKYPTITCNKIIGVWDEDRLKGWTDLPWSESYSKKKIGTSIIISRYKEKALGMKFYGLGL